LLSTSWSTFATPRATGPSRSLIEWLNSTVVFNIKYEHLVLKFEQAEPCESRAHAVQGLEKGQWVLLAATKTSVTDALPALRAKINSLEERVSTAATEVAAAELRAEAERARAHLDTVSADAGRIMGLARVESITTDHSEPTAKWPVRYHFKRVYRLHPNVKCVGAQSVLTNSFGARRAPRARRRDRSASARVRSGRVRVLGRIADASRVFSGMLLWPGRRSACAVTASAGLSRLRAT
jgi:hypothetical protein